ncbi:Membrane protease YdiL, CAAX protease family [Paenibacillus sp. yr247]|uniref:CPBP family intramembrane glutamic endopeptidase n=1 Tax=Paenibacillus sp. yr247 TaxID=1761880 RepID=UPI000891B1FD|nr:CPBP family intramembrane glutamic endopeptidase [Paenibacillus sp. yr247]SDO43890.1 Membrane protease YdiL, CAAX protease family [Paenibacillus sp. yr247]
MLRPKLNRFLLILACIGITLYVGISALYGLQTEEAPSTENPSISKVQAADRAASFVSDRYALQDTQTFVVYQSKKERSGYLQKEHLSEAYKMTYGERYPVDYYQVSVEDKKTNRQFEVEINYTNAAVIGWRETQTSTESFMISKQKADILAKQEMRAQGLDPDEMTLIDKPATEEQAYGTILYYEKQSKPIGEAKLQVRVEFDDKDLTGYSVLFSLPASHQAWLEQQDHSASVMTWISMGFTVIMTIAAIVFAIIYRKHIKFSRGLLLTAIFLAIYISNNMNMYPAFKAVSGAVNNELMTWVAIIFMNVVTILLGISLYFALTAGNGLWDSIGQRKWPAWKETIFGTQVFHGMGRGYLLALFILGVQQVLFYTGEVNFDVWAVNDPSDSILNMLEPRFFPLMAWVAAISEEATYRLLGIILFKKLFRNNFIAVVIPSVIWAASHTQYPIYPVYTRLVEVTIIGIILGYVFLKYGFITAVFAHASMDSILMGMSLFSLGHVSDVLAGIFYILLPGLIGVALAWLHGKRRSPLIPGEPPPRLEVL